MHLNRFIPRGLALAALLAFTPFAATSAEEEEDASLIEEIVVTAQKRDQALMDVPMSVSALSADDVATMGAVNLADIQFKVPSLFISSFGGIVETIRIRGISPPGSLLPTVGRLVDEMTINAETTGYGLSFPLVDIERVEVLKGPQGTLYGEGSISGTVKYLTRNPTPGEVDGIFEISGRSVDDGGDGYRGWIAGNLPFGSDVFGVRLAGYFEESPGWVDSTFVGDDANTLDRWLVRAKAVFTPNERFTARLLWERQENEVPMLGYSDLDFQTNSYFPVPSSTEYDMANLVLEFDAGNFSITSSTGYQDRVVVTAFDISGYKAIMENPLDLNFDGVPETLSPFAGLTDWSYLCGIAIPMPCLSQPIVPNYITNIGYWLDTVVDTLTQEVRINTEIGERWLLTAGVYYKDSEHFAPLISEYYPDPNILPIQILEGTLLIQTEATAYFAEAVVSITDRLEGTVGVRYYTDERNSENIVALFGGAITVIDGLDNDSTVARAVLKYDFSEDLMAYASFSQGFRSGGVQFFDSEATLGLPNTFDPEELATYEVGAKGVLGDGRFRYEIAAFFMDYENIQVYFSNPLGIQAFNNAGAAEVVGFEFQGTLRVSEGFYVEASYGHNDGEYTEPGVTHLAGEPMDSVPKFTMSISGDYTFGLPAGFLGHIRADYMASDDTYIRARGFGYVNEQLENEGLVTLNLRAGVRRDNWSVYLFVENLTDEEKQISKPFATLLEYFIQQPRTMGITVRGGF